MNAFEKLKPFLEEFRKKNQLMSILNYDIATNTPEQAIEEESDLLNDLASQEAAMQKDPAFIQAVKEAAASDLTPRQRKVVSEYLREIEFFEKIPLEAYEEFSRLASKSNEMWRKYKPTGDFASWLPYWEKMIASFRHLLTYRQKPGMSLYEAALDLGASRFLAFRKVILPDIMPGVLSGFLLAFTLSLDDFVITHFVKGPGFDTLSTKIYTEVRKGIKPEMYALSTLIFASVLLLLLILNHLPGSEKKA